MRDDRIPGQKPPDLRIVEAAFHVDEAELLVVLVPGEAALRLGSESDRRGSPGGIPPRAEGVIAPLLHPLTPGLVRHGLDRAEVVDVQIPGLLLR
jgi:hypothetical protein